MQIDFYKYDGKSNVINKTLAATPNAANGLLHGDFDVIQPQLIVRTAQNEVPFPYNYCYIPNFSRYYFVSDVEILDNQRTLLTLKIDVLNTYKTAILAATATATNRENAAPYISTRQNIHDVRPQFTKIAFSVQNPFVENGDIILTTIKGNV